MRWLWLTLADPDPPTNGQYIYSGGLIRSVAAAGAEVDVLAFARPGAPRADGRREGSIRWWLADHSPRSRWAGLVSPLPALVDRTRTLSLQDMLDTLLSENHWDAIVFDGLALGWALHAISERWPNKGERPRLAYVASNHEESVAAKIVDIEPRWMKRQVKRLDASRVARLERSLVRHADLVTSNAPEDCMSFRAHAPDKRIEFLPPGYAGRKIVERRITANVPRRAVLVGSFDWLPKRRNLEEFLAVADSLFAEAGVELQVVGSAEDAYLRRLRREVRATTFTGPVDDVTGYLERARIGLVPERVGGGFKLKVLDYVFNRVPIAALVGSMPGAPLRDRESALLCCDHRELAKRVVEAIDNFEILNRLQEHAYLACEGKFDWDNVARRFLEALAGLQPLPLARPAMAQALADH